MTMAAKHPRARAPTAIVPAWNPVQRYLENLLAACAAERSGEIADYIPQLARAARDDFAIALATTDGQLYAVGDVETRFTIQSMSKPFTYGIALEDRGRDGVFEKIGVEPSGEAFNLISLEEGTGRPLNPMINAGAITASSLVAGASVAERLQRVLGVYGACAGRDLEIDESTFESERSSGHRNRAIGHMLRTFDILVEDPAEALELYFRQCAVSVDARDVALMAATLANSGVHPITGRRAFAPETVDTVLSVMTTCGMYDGTGDWVERVGMPAKSGVSGGILAVLPGQLGLCVYSPPLDPRGNSVRGVEACRRLAQDLQLHFLHVTRSSRSVIRASYDVASVPSKRTRSLADQAFLEQAGRRVAVYELQGDLLFAGIERVLRLIVERADELDAVILDLRAVSLLSDAAAVLLGDLRDALAGGGTELAVVERGEHDALAKALRRGPTGAAPPAFFDRDAATEWAEEVLLGERMRVGGAVALADCQLCRGLGAEHLARLESLLEHRLLTPGEWAVRAGEPGRELFIVLDGDLSVTVELPSGPRRLGTIAAGATFGELAFIGRSLRTADVRADRVSELAILDAAAFEELEHSCPELQAALLRNLLRSAYAIVERANREVASVVSA